MKHDKLLSESPLSSGPRLFNQAIRDLFNDSTNVDRQLIKFSALTGQPAPLVPMLKPDTDSHVLLPRDQCEPTRHEESVPTQPTNARTRRSRTRHLARSTSAGHRHPEAETPTRPAHAAGAPHAPPATTRANASAPSPDPPGRWGPPSTESKSADGRVRRSRVLSVDRPITLESPQMTRQIMRW